MAAPRRVLVVGLGNPDRGDDGVGPLVVEKLAGLLPPDVAVAAPGADALTLMTEWANFDAVICIDAAAPLTAPGCVHRLNLAASDLPRERLATSSHAFGLADAVGLAHVLRQAPRDIIVFAIEGESFGAGAAITPQVAAAAGEVAVRVVAEVASLRRRGSDEQA